MKLHDFLFILILLGPFVALLVSVKFEEPYKNLTPEQQKVLLDSDKRYNEMMPEQSEKYKRKNKKAYNAYIEKELDEIGITPSEGYEPSPIQYVDRFQVFEPPEDYEPPLYYVPSEDCYIPIDEDCEPTPNYMLPDDTPIPDHPPSPYSRW